MARFTVTGAVPRGLSQRPMSRLAAGRVYHCRLIQIAVLSVQGWAAHLRESADPFQDVRARLEVERLAR